MAVHAIIAALHSGQAFIQNSCVSMAEAAECIEEKNAGI
jgi:hypothetical protein